MSVWKNVKVGKINLAQERFWEGVGDKADVIAEEMAYKSGFVEKLVNFALYDGFVATASQKQARKIMGENFFGVEEVIKYFRVAPKQEDLATLASIPFPKKTLEACKDTHYLLAVFPMSIQDMRNLRLDKVYVAVRDEYMREKFVHDRGILGWHLVLKTNVSHQKKNLTFATVVPSVQVVAYMVVAHYMKTGRMLLVQNDPIETATCGSNDYPVAIGLRGIDQSFGAWHVSFEFGPYSPHMGCSYKEGSSVVPTSTEFKAD